MSFAMPCVTSFMIIMQKANLEHRLMMIAHTLQNLTLQSSEEQQRMYNEYTNYAMAMTGEDDESDVAVDVMNWDKFCVERQAMMAQFNAKEKMLETEKIQIESQLQSLNTMQDGVDKMISDGAKDFAYGS